MMLLRSLLVVLATSLMGTEAWVAMQQPGTSLRPPTAARAVTRWDRHLDMAKNAHKRRDWGHVRLLCSRVISAADDWNAVEQAHLRLALVEQKDEKIDAARRVFQVCGCGCVIERARERERESGGAAAQGIRDCYRCCCSCCSIRTLNLHSCATWVCFLECTLYQLLRVCFIFEAGDQPLSSVVSSP